MRGCSGWRCWDWLVFLVYMMCESDGVQSRPHSSPVSASSVTRHGGGQHHHLYLMGYVTTSPISLEKNNISHAFMLKCSCSLDHPLFSFPCEVRYSQIIVLSLIIKNTWWKGGSVCWCWRGSTMCWNRPPPPRREVKRVKEHSPPPAIWKKFRLIP